MLFLIPDDAQGYIGGVITIFADVTGPLVCHHVTSPHSEPIGSDQVA